MALPLIARVELRLRNSFASGTKNLSVGYTSLPVGHNLGVIDLGRPCNGLISINLVVDSVLNSLRSIATVRVHAIEVLLAAGVR